MKTIGIIAEYNPFHNGHLYHINKIKEMFKDSMIILVMSGNFTQRADASIINKWDKTEIALRNNIDLVVELPFEFTCESADIFAFGACSILNHLKVDYLVFGSESNDIITISKIADIQLTNEYDLKVKEYIDKGINYPTALSKALESFGYKGINSPNDILGISYVRELKKLNSKIIPLTIKRTNEHNSTKLTKYITSASSIRENIKKKKIKKYVPSGTYKYLKNKLYFIDDYFPLLKYKILSDIDNLNIYHGIEEGIENKIKKVIYDSNSYNELIMNIKSKRYTYSKIKRMLLSILVGYTKEDAKKRKDINYIRILGFNKKGQKYLNEIKKKINIPIYTNYNKDLNLELKVTSIYDCNLVKKEIMNLIKE
ncbi:MAG: nucleotidyltransferase [Bacilli bacterium]|nr:nucleotidyltransferase [Bacilli bacterium]